MAIVRHPGLTDNTAYLLRRTKYQGQTVTQSGRIALALRAAGDRGICGSTLADEGIFRYAARIHELRAKRYPIEADTCEQCGVAVYRLSPEIETRNLEELRLSGALGR